MGLRCPAPEATDITAILPRFVFPLWSLTQEATVIVECMGTDYAD